MSASDRIAGAPISWGVCEVPGWGYQLDRSRVLTEMREVGLTATELGPDGFLPEDPEELAVTLARYQLRAVGGFVPIVLHDGAADPLPGIRRLLPGYVAANAGVMVLSAVSGIEGYDTRVDLSAAQWRVLLANLDRVAEEARGSGVQAVLHPHVGTIIERRAEIDRVLERSAIPLCLDTGHVLIGGTDPADLTRQVPDRIGHTHLKDVDATIAARVRNRELSYTDAVRAGMYRPLGQGDVDIAGIVGRLEASGYHGWYTLEQDTILAAQPSGEGPLVDIRASAAYIRGVIADGLR